MAAEGRPLRVAVAGAGWVSQHHLAAWRSIPMVELVGIADPDLSAAHERARQFAIPYVQSDVMALLDEVRPDALDIATPVASHGALCRAAADLGVAILCQKPLAETLGEAEHIVRYVGDRAPFMVHENWRFRPHYRSIKSMLAEGRIGNPLLVNLAVRSSGLLPDASGVRPALVRQPFLAQLPRFLVFELLIHHFDVLRWLLGDLTVRSAMLRRATGATVGEDTVVVELRTTSGLSVHLDATFACPGAPAYVADYLEIVGSRETARLDDTRLHVDGMNSGSITPTFEDTYAAAYRGAISEFVHALRTPRPFEITPDDHLQALRLVEEVYAVADTF